MSTIKMASHSLVFLSVISLVIGCAIGYTLSNALDSEIIPPKEALEGGTTIVPNAPAPSDNSALLKRISELEAQLAERENNISNERNDNPRHRGRNRRNNESANDDSDRTEDKFSEELYPMDVGYIKRLEKEDPERYQEMKSQFEMMRKQVKSINTSRYDFVNSIDTANMTPEMKQAHDDLLERLKYCDTFTERMFPDSDNPLTFRERGELFNAYAEIGELMNAERQYLLYELGRGYGEDGTDFTEFIEEIYNNTSSPMPLQPMGSRGNRRGPHRGNGNGQDRPPRGGQL